MLRCISKAYDNESSGVARNATIWAQFSKTLDTDTVNYVSVSVANTADNYIPVEGTVQAIKEGIRCALKDRLERRKAIVSNLTWQKISENYIQLYREVGVI